MIMNKAERKSAEIVRDVIKNILPDLKLAYESAKDLVYKHNWEIDYWKMSEAYMNLAHEYIGIMAVLEEDDKGGTE